MKSFKKIALIVSAALLGSMAVGTPAHANVPTVVVSVNTVADNDANTIAGAAVAAVPADNKVEAADAVKFALTNIVAGNVYAFVPESVVPPAVVCVPDSPYLEFETISKANIRAKINMTITVAVAYNSNPASLDNIEQLVISVLAVIPAGYIVSSVERPTVTQVGASTVVCQERIRSATTNVSMPVPRSIAWRDKSC